MNTQRLLDIIAYIEKHPEQYDQSKYHSECGTTHCIAGFAQLAYDRIYSAENYVATPNTVGHIFSKAITYLGISVDEGDYLFYSERTLNEIRVFAETGEICHHIPTYF